MLKISKKGVVRSDLILDRVSATVSIESASERAWINAGIEKLKASLAYAGEARGRYKAGVRVYVGDVMDRTMLIQANPWLPSLSYFRVEYNPAKVASGAIRAFIEKTLPGGWGRFVQSAKCTRIDLAVDVTGMRVSDVLVYWPGMRRSRQIFGSGHVFEDSYLQTREVGAYDGDRHLTIYDRSEQIRKQNKKLILKEDVPLGDVTRFEFRIRPRAEWSQVASMKNVFDEVNVSEVGNFYGANDLSFRRFLRLCQVDGAQNTLLMYSEAERKAFRKMLSQAYAPWWDSAEIWKNFNPMLSAHLG